MKEKVTGFIKKDTVLCVAMTLAMVSAFFAKPTLNYVNYIDFRVLGILLSLMTVMAGLQRNGLFDMIGSSLLKRTKNTMQLSLVLVFLCFFFSMFITNDVSLITFVPFAMLTLRKCNQEKLLIPVIIVQTIAANLGSMLTPIGNPQNLYLYNLAEMKMSTFIGIIGPYTLASGILLLLSVAVVCRKKEKIEFTLEENNSDHEIEKERLHLRRKAHQKNAVYLILLEYADYKLQEKLGEISGRKDKEVQALLAPDLAGMEGRLRNVIEKIDSGLNAPEELVLEEKSQEEDLLEENETDAEVKEIEEHI